MQEDSNWDFAIQVLLLGQAGVGKTNIISQFINGQFNENACPTVGTDYSKKFYHTQDSKIMVKCWDTAGMERFAMLSSTIIKNADCFVLVYDITDRSSFDKITTYLSFLKGNNKKNISLTLMGNKNDLESSRRVSKEEAIAFADENDMLFFETSAKTNENNCIDKAMNDLLDRQAKFMLSENKERMSMVDGQLLKIQRGVSKRELLETNGEKKSGCC